MTNLGQQKEEIKKKKRNTFESVNALYEGRQLILLNITSKIPNSTCTRKSR